MFSLQSHVQPAATHNTILLPSSTFAAVPLTAAAASSFHPLVRPILHSTTEDLYLSLLFPLSSPESPKVCVSAPNSGYVVVCNSLQEYALRYATHSEMSSDSPAPAAPAVELYNSFFTPPHVPGETAKFLKYGHAKYTLLRVGPFRDLYESLSLSKLSSLSSSPSPSATGELDVLSSAEASNGKFGTASSFLFYSRLLAGLQGREDEARDAARNVMKADGVSAVAVDL
eukprot:CAMPEP_0182465756 /NCGR_PEP_ID=MMETSP1319-20130603/10611_1 /TAXON_ID=172717 /ORGANISM="Bolidomonas pacifica, Strain RCC208" /LENGTH=227 /DNA_ID=CAMNT_0024665599 /DNA_START=209 /DNA_END=888 /DNA_ORIENTATION=+